LGEFTKTLSDGNSGRVLPGARHAADILKRRNGRRNLLRTPLQYDGTQSRQRQRARARWMIALRPVQRSLSGRQILQAVKRQLEAILNAQFLEQPRINEFLFLAVDSRSASLMEA
jgi:hypothetical protein